MDAIPDGAFLEVESIRSCGMESNSPGASWGFKREACVAEAPCWTNVSPSKFRSGRWAWPASADDSDRMGSAVFPPGCIIYDWSARRVSPAVRFLTYVMVGEVDLCPCCSRVLFLHFPLFLPGVFQQEGERQEEEDQQDGKAVHKHIPRLPLTHSQAAHEQQLFSVTQTHAISYEWVIRQMHAPVFVRCISVSAFPWRRGRTNVSACVLMLRHGDATHVSSSVCSACLFIYLMASLLSFWILQREQLPCSSALLENSHSDEGWWNPACTEIWSF